MGWLSIAINQGDWVKSTRTIPISINDRLSGGGIAAGTRGVVTAITGTRITVEFDTRWGLCTAIVPARGLTRIRREGGVQQFRQRAHTSTLIRIGLALALAFPILYFTGWYLWTYHTFDGIVPAFVQTSLDSLTDWLAAALAHPVQTVIASILLAAIGRWVFQSR